MNYESQKKKILALDSDTDWWNLMPRNERQIEASHGSNVYVFKTLIVPAEVVLRLSFNLTIDTWPKKTKQRQFQPNKEINHSPKNIFAVSISLHASFRRTSRTFQSFLVVVSRSTCSYRTIRPCVESVVQLFPFGSSDAIGLFLLHCIDLVSISRCNFIRPPKP